MTIIRELLCKIGIHKWKFHCWSEYRYSSGTWSHMELKAEVSKCGCCGKKTLPRWADAEFRRKYPYIDLTGWPRDWRKDW